MKTILFLFLSLPTTVICQVMNNPYRWQACTFANGGCIRYEFQAVTDNSDVNSRITFKNTPYGDASKATPSWQEYIEMADGSRVFVMMDEDCFAISDKNNSTPQEFHEHLIGRVQTISFKGWDGNYHYVNFLNAKYGFGIKDAPPKIVIGTGDYWGPGNRDEWSRGMASTMYCGNSPESWVRASAKFDQASGICFITVQLETDAVDAGPKGIVTVIFKDAAGNSIANATSSEVGTGGKDWSGHAASRTVTSQIKLEPSIAKRVASIFVQAQCTGRCDRILNISLDDLLNAIKFVVKIFGI